MFPNVTFCDIVYVRDVSIKIYDLNNMTKDMLGALENEKNIMRAVDHKNIQKLYEIETFSTNNGQRLVMVFENTKRGELFDIIMQTSFFEETLARTFFHELIAAIQHCHDRNIFHRDIK